jgi:hypothetical protein
MNPLNDFKIFYLLNNEANKIRELVGKNLYIF